MELNKLNPSVLTENTVSSDSCIDAILLCPGLYLKEIRIGNTTADFQELLGNEVDITPYPFDDYAVIISPTVEHSDSLPPNRALRWPDRDILIVFNGNFIIVGGTREDGYRSLTKKQKRRYLNEFHQPEVFALYNENLIVTPIPEELIETPED